MVDFSQARVTMVDTQVRPSDVTRYPVIEAMLTVPREDFVPSARRQVAYAGENMALGDDRVLLEARTLAKMVDALAPGLDDVVLDVACGTGYATAVLAAMSRAVIGLESDPARASEAQSVLTAQGVDNAAIITGPLAAGASAEGPYDAMIVSGGAIEVLPDALAAQLREGGRVAAIFLEGNLGVVRLGLVHQGRVVWRDIFNASAPLLPDFAHSSAFSL